MVNKEFFTTTGFGARPLCLSVPLVHSDLRAELMDIFTSDERRHQSFEACDRNIWHRLASWREDYNLSSFKFRVLRSWGLQLSWSLTARCDLCSSLDERQTTGTTQSHSHLLASALCLDHLSLLCWFVNGQIICCFHASLGTFHLSESIVDSLSQEALWVFPVFCTIRLFSKRIYFLSTSFFKFFFFIKHQPHPSSPTSWGHIWRKCRGAHANWGMVF